MRTIIISFLLLPIFAAAQNQRVFIKLTDANGKQVQGGVTVKGFEKTVEGLTYSENCTMTEPTWPFLSKVESSPIQMIFTAGIIENPAFTKVFTAIAGKSIPSAVITIVQANAMGGFDIMYTATLTNIKVIASTQQMGCNSAMVTSVTLQPGIIDLSSYKQSPDGSGPSKIVGNKLIDNQ